MKHNPSKTLEIFIPPKFLPLPNQLLIFPHFTILDIILQQVTHFHPGFFCLGSLLRRVGPCQVIDIEDERPINGTFFALETRFLP
jgi:hypothetical protein